jgi:hypothetical protein
MSGFGTAFSDKYREPRREKELEEFLGDPIYFQNYR